MKRFKNNLQIVLIALFVQLSISRILQVTLPRQNPFTKKNLKRKVIKENRKWERELSMGGKFSISKTLGSRWGIDTLNKHFSKDRGENLVSVPLSKSKVSLMNLSDKVFDFIDQHKLTLKGQSDKGNSLRFALNLKKSADSIFQVKVGKNGQNYGVKFMSKEPFMSKSIKVLNEQDLQNKMGKFLNTSLKQWKKFSARRLSLKPRQLLGVDQLPDVMTGIAGDELEVKNVEGEEKLYDLIDKKDEFVIAKIEIKEADDGQPLVEISNKDIPEFEKTHKIANRTVGPQDTKEDLELFFKPHFQDFEQRYEAWKNSKSDLKDLMEMILEENKELEDRKIDNQVVVGDAEDPTMVVLRDWKVKDQSAFFEAQLYKINPGYFGIHVIQGNNELEMQVPVIMTPEQKKETTRSVKRIMSSGEYTQLVDFADANAIFLQALQDQDCDASVENGAGNNIVKYDIKENEKCVYASKTFILVNIDFSGMRYVHLLLDNDYFKGEHLITMTTENSFRDNLNRVLFESKGQLASVEDAYKRSQEPVTTDMDGIVNLIKEILKDKTTESDKDGVKIFKAKIFNRDLEVIRVKKIDQDEGPSLFRLTIFDVNQDSNAKKPRAHHEFILYENNGYDQLNVLRGEIEKVATKLS